MTIAMKRKIPALLVLPLICLLFMVVPMTSAFVSVRMGIPQMKKSLQRVAKPMVIRSVWPDKKNTIHGGYHRYHRSVPLSIGAKQDDEDPPTTDIETKTTPGAGAVDNFDGEGFANYLLPYAIALIGSILATVAVFKFVLLNY